MDHHFEQILQHGNASLKGLSLNSSEIPEKKQLQLLLINMLLLRGANCHFHEFMWGGTFQILWGPTKAKYGEIRQRKRFFYMPTVQTSAILY